MKFFAATVLLGLALADVQDVACPTITQQILNPGCSQACDNADCTYVTTVQNPCGCPASIPTATLLAPCDAGCPYNGCEVEFRSSQRTCGPTSMTTTTRTRTRPTPTSTTSTSSPSVSTGVTTLPPISTPTTAACPTITKHTQPSDCEPIRCPIPSCFVQENLEIPCGCDGPKTLLYVEGCSTACAEGCATRTSTVSESCARATGLQ